MGEEMSIRDQNILTELGIYTRAVYDIECDVACELETGYIHFYSRDVAVWRPYRKRKNTTDTDERAWRPIYQIKLTPIPHRKYQLYEREVASVDGLNCSLPIAEIEIDWRLKAYLREREAL